MSLQMKKAKTKDAAHVQISGEVKSQSKVFLIHRPGSLTAPYIYNYIYIPYKIMKGVVNKI